MTATKADLDAVLTTIETSLANLETEMNSAFARLDALIAAGGGTVDLGPEVQRLTDLQSGIDSAVAQAQTEGQGSTPPPAPAPFSQPRVKSFSPPIK